LLTCIRLADNVMSGSNKRTLNGQPLAQKRVRFNEPKDSRSCKENNESSVNVRYSNKSTKSNPPVHVEIPVKKEEKRKYSFDIGHYGSEINQTQKRTELRAFNKIGAGINWNGNPINMVMRGILVNWMTEVVEEYHLRRISLFLAVSFLNRFLQSTNEIHRHLLQLVGITCLWVAAKFEEVEVPDLDEFVYITDNTYTSAEIISTERFILVKLEYDLATVTTEHFLYRYLEVGEVLFEAPVIHAKFFAELSLTHYPLSKQYLPSLIAASIVCAVKHIHNLQPIITPQFLSYTEFQSEQLVNCVKHLLYCFKHLAAQPSALVERYKLEKISVLR